MSLLHYPALAIAFLGFFVWGHHMFVSGQSIYAGVLFSVLTYLIGIPTAIKIFNWVATLYKGSIVPSQRLCFMRIGFHRTCSSLVD